MCLYVHVCVFSSDLKKCNLSSTWKKQAHEHQSWRTVIKHGVEGLNRKAEEDEKQKKDEKKRCREQMNTDMKNLLQYSLFGVIPWQG